MKSIVEYELRDGEVLIEVDDVQPTAQPAMRTRGGTSLAEGDQRRFETLLDGLEPIVLPIAERLKPLSASADVEVTFGLKVSAGGRFVIVSGSVEASLSVKLSWRKQSDA